MKTINIILTISIICTNCVFSDIWGHKLEEWTLKKATTTQRDNRVLQLRENENNNAGEREGGEEKESKVIPGKIISTNTPIRIKKPSGSSQQHQHAGEGGGGGGGEISETDLYLLNAIEKLVHRTDFMEKRLRRMEEMLYYVMAGNRIDHDAPCPNNFTRISRACYHFSTNAGREQDWKVASKSCKKMGASLAELETIEENQDVIVAIQNNSQLRGKDFWTGGLNPGLLWIWSNSARPIESSGNKQHIYENGRCLRLAYDPALRSYTYKGSDCSVRYSYICEIVDTNSSNEVKRLGKSMGILEEL